MPKLYTPKTAISTEDPDGTPLIVRVGEVAEEGSWVVERFGELFEPLEVTYRAEPKPRQSRPSSKDD